MLLSPCVPSVLVFSQSVSCDLTKGMKPLVEGCCSCPGVSWGQPVRTWAWRSAFRHKPCGPAFRASSLAVMADRMEWGGGVQRGPVQHTGWSWDLSESSRLASSPIPGPVIVQPAFPFYPQLSWWKASQGLWHREKMNVVLISFAIRNELGEYLLSTSYWVGIEYLSILRGPAAPRAPAQEPQEMGWM